MRPKNNGNMSLVGLNVAPGIVRKTDGATETKQAISFSKAGNTANTNPESSSK